MRVSYRRRHARADGKIPDFLRSELVSGTWERTGFDIDFPAIATDPVVAAAVGYTGRNFLAESVDITRWYNRASKVIAGSVVFSSGCEGPPGIVHGGAVSSALDDILGTMAWREAGFSRWGIPTLQLTVRFKGTTPMERQLRFDTRTVKREGRKVFVEASLRDLSSGNKLLAEGEGLFYVRPPPPPPPPPPAPIPSAEHTSRPSPHPAVGAVAGPSPSSSASSEAPSTTPPGADGEGAKCRTRGQGQPRASSSPSRRLSSQTTSLTNAASAVAPAPAPAPATRDLLSYDEAIREFGPRNPNAAANVVAFYGGDLSMLHRTAKL